MTDKFPEIDVVAPEGDDISNSDFLSREKEALGDEFATPQDHEVNTGDDQDDEFEDFKSQFPDVDSQEATIAAAPQGEDTMDDAHGEAEPQGEDVVTPVVNRFENLDLNESEHIKEWKKTRDLEISKRDEIAARKLEEIKKEAEKAIDDFYENYNNKKDDAIAETKKEEKAFLEKREKFLEKGTTWDRVVELLKLTKNSDAIDAENYRDKTRFRDLLLALKGKENVPGASGV